MIHFRVVLLRVLAVLAIPGLTLGAQSLSGTDDLPNTVEAIDHARVTTRILCITAHPDDEPAALLTYLSRGLGADVALLSITRGEGGQNAIGPEEGPQLAVLRSHELLAATRIYGIHLFFTRARDTGYVKTVEAAEKVWGNTALADMVHVIRYFQPNIVINSWGGVHSGHGHHQASGILTPQAVAAAADPKQFPGDLQPWHVDQILDRYRGEGEKGWEAPTDQISPLWGRTYAEMGREGDYQHRTQGIAGFLSGPYLSFRVDLVDEQTGAAADPARFAEPLAALAARYPALSGARPELERAGQEIGEARRSALSLDWPAAARQLAAAGKQITAAAGALSRAASAGASGEEQARRELGRVRESIDHALQLAAALRIDARASRREAVPGETLAVTASLQFREHTITPAGRVALDVPAGWTVGETSGDGGEGGGYRFTLAVPAAARPAHGPDDWMFPVPPPLVRAKAVASVEGYTFSVYAPVTEVRASSTQIEYLPLQIVPRVTLTLEPREVLVPPSRRGGTQEEVVRVHYYGSAPAQMEVGLDTPPAWPRVSALALKFDGPGDQLARLRIRVPQDAGAATLSLQSYAVLGGQRFGESVEPLPTLSSWLWTEPASMTLCLPDLVVPEHLRVGYVAAENDPIPEVLREAGISVDLLDPAALAFNDLSQYDAIAVGIRAYELRSDLAEENQRLLDYARAGGTLVVQYQRAADWNRLLPAPYPARVGVPTLRITDQNSPVRFLAPGSPLLVFPNRISMADFDGWVQERGLYFLDDYDSHYTPILAMRDPGESDLTGGLVVASLGKGTYIYTGLSFFRQLPAGVQGPIRLFVNLLSQSRAPRTP
ncbi:MAG TPA: PIG-L family deacetylase [Candidatus Acidoferrales bacterium]|nr:PIG-L family deacetylase [Candidatus Acidoferrales bacterium]